MITVFIINLVKIFRKKEFRQGSQGETLGKVSGGNEDWLYLSQKQLTISNDSKMPLPLDMVLVLLSLFLKDSSKEMITNAVRD